MSKDLIPWLNTTEAGSRLGLVSSTVWRVCKRYPGFGIKFSNHYRIPASHVDRVLSGETVAAVAASPSWRDAGGQEAA